MFLYFKVTLFLLDDGNDISILPHTNISLRLHTQVSIVIPVFI